MEMHRKPAMNHPLVLLLLLIVAALHGLRSISAAIIRAHCSCFGCTPLIEASLESFESDC